MDRLGLGGGGGARGGGGAFGGVGFGAAAAAGPAPAASAGRSHIARRHRGRAAYASDGVENPDKLIKRAAVRSTIGVSYKRSLEEVAEPTLRETLYGDCKEQKEDQRTKAAMNNPIQRYKMEQEEKKKLKEKTKVKALSADDADEDGPPDPSPPKDRVRAQFNEAETLPSKVRVPFAVGETLHSSNPRIRDAIENKRPIGRRERELSEEPWDLYAQQIARGIVHPKVYEKTPSNLHHSEMLTSITGAWRADGLARGRGYGGRCITRVMARQLLPNGPMGRCAMCAPQTAARDCARTCHGISLEAVCLKTPQRHRAGCSSHWLAWLKISPRNGCRRSRTCRADRRPRSPPANSA